VVLADGYAKQQDISFFENECIRIFHFCFNHIAECEKRNGADGLPLFFAACLIRGKESRHVYFFTFCVFNSETC
jgi:hypothetical protein